MVTRNLPRRSPYLPLLVALVVAVVATVVYVLSPAGRDAAAIATVTELLEQKRYGDAITASEKRLSGREGPPALHVLVTRARILESFSTKKDVGDVQRIGREGMERWSTEGEVPFEVVRALQPEHSLVSWVWFAKQAYERGMPPSPEVRDALLASLETRDPLDSEMDLTRDVLLRFHSAETLVWAAKAIDAPKAEPFLNAQKVLEQGGDARATDAHALDLRDLLRGDRMEEAKKRLLAEPPERRAHSKAVLADGAGTLTFRKSNRVEVIAAAEAL